jgi:hypothetical protein
MLSSFRQLLRTNSRAYWLIITCESSECWETRSDKSKGTIIQTGLELWCTLSVAAVIIRFQPDSQGMVHFGSMSKLQS